MEIKELPEAKIQVDLIVIAFHCFPSEFSLAPIQVYQKQSFQLNDCIVQHAKKQVNGFTIFANYVLYTNSMPMILKHTQKMNRNWPIFTRKLFVHQPKKKYKQKMAGIHILSESNDLENGATSLLFLQFFFKFRKKFQRFFLFLVFLDIHLRIRAICSSDSQNANFA